MWTLEQAAGLCREIEALAPAFGCHVALTGGVLYKDGARKDLDLVFYRIRQVAEVDIDGLFLALLREVGIERVTEETRWCVKATYGGRKIDCFFPEVPKGDYPTDTDTPPPKAVELPRFDIGEF